MTKTIEELENKILSGDFDEYTLNEYNSAIRLDQYKIDIEKACYVYRNELTQIINLLNKVGDNYKIDKLGELLSLDGCVKDFKQAMEEGQ